jgi:hypothetical protein
MIRLNYCLHQIGAVPSADCACGKERETIGHFLFQCTQWTAYRTGGFKRAGTREDDISRYLGGKSSRDGEKWEPDLAAMQATIRYVMATERLNED